MTGLATLDDGVRAWLDDDVAPNIAGLDARIARAVVTCGLCPLQIEGELVDGRLFYFRSRHFTVQLGLGATEDEAVRAAMTTDTFLTYGFDDDEVALAPAHLSELLDTLGVARSPG